MLKYNYEKQVINMTQISNQNDDARITGCNSCTIAGYHTVTFYGNDSCCSRASGLPAMITVPDCRYLTLPDIVPVRRGYCFCQWNTGRCCEGEFYLPGETIPPLTEDLHLYANWKENRSGCPCPPPAPAASFTAQKLDTTTGAPVAGASYTLLQDGVNLMDSISDSLGRITFTGLRPGIYELEETSAPSGYEPDATMHQVIVDTDGTVTIDGRPADSYFLYNQPEEGSRLTFIKTDSLTGQPLAGASYTLSDGSAAISAGDGTVDFGTLPPGTYTLTETEAPAGYTYDPAVYTIVVTAGGIIMVNGRELSEFKPQNTRLQSERPVISSIEEGDTVVTGTGIPGAAITVLFPDGTQANTTVDTDGQWNVPVPAASGLHAGDTVYAGQTVPGLGPSDNASFVVQPRR